MTRAALTSISTREAAPSPARKNLRRTAPVTSTTSPARQVATVLRTRPLQTEQSRASTAARDGPASRRGTTTRNVHNGSPLGSVRSSGSCESRPTRRTSLTASSMTGGSAVLADADFVRADMHITSDAHASRPRRQSEGTAEAVVENEPGHEPVHEERAPPDAACASDEARPRSMFGGVLLAHSLPVAVPSALAGLTSGFGMGPGVSLSLWPP